MRNRILAGVGVAAIATLGLAAPAQADTADTADLYVVHGVPGEGDFPVDIYANGAIVEALAGVTFGTVTEAPLELPAGDYTIDIVAADAEAPAEGEGLLTLDATLAAGDSVTAVAHLTAAGEARLTVRHAAAAPAVDVPAGAVEAAVAAAGTTDPVIGPAELPLAAGTNTLVHAIGSLEDENLAFAVITIDGRGAAPEGVPAGSAGLVAENNTGALVGGAALLIALLAAAGITARRATASSK